MSRRRQILLVGVVSAGFLGGGAVASTIASIGSTLAQIEWRLPRPSRPDVIKPVVGIASPIGKTYPVTLYEYVDREHYIVSGRTITYGFPSAYYSSPLPRPGRSVLHFSIQFDLATGVPWTKVPKRLLQPRLDMETR